MLTSFAALVILLLMASGCAALFRCRVEKMLPVCFCSVILWLYPFYLCSAVRLGVVLLCSAGILIFLAGWYRKRTVKSYAALIFTPGTVTYLCICVIFLIFFSGNVVSLHDELRLWGAVPKAIHATGKLQLGNDSPIFSVMQSYPPALPLLCYFFTAFSGTFSEGALYVGYACMALSFFIPAFSKWEWKEWRLLAQAGLAILLIPLCLTSHCEDYGMFGMALYVDPLLGIAMGYGFIMARNKPQMDVICSVCFAVVLGTICLLKNTGIVFAAAALIVFLVLERKTLNGRILLPVLALPATIGSWKLLLLLRDVHDVVPLRMHWLSIEEILNVLHAIVSRPMVAYKVSLGFFGSFVFVYSIMWVAFCAVSRTSAIEEQKRDGWVAAGFLTSAIAYIYGYALIYGRNLESFARYMASLLLGLAVYLLAKILPDCTHWKLFGRLSGLRRGVALTIAGACLMTAIGTVAVWRSLFLVNEVLAEEDAEAQHLYQLVQQNLSDGEEAWIYLVIAGDGVENSHIHHRIFFDLISPNINLRNGFAQTQVVVPGRSNPAEVWAQELKNGCNFVYLLSVEDALRPVFNELSQDAPEPQSLYRVYKSDNAYGIELRRV